jgi:hypothetical protein
MTRNTDAAMASLLLGEAGSDPIEDRLRANVRATIEALFDEEGPPQDLPPRVAAQIKAAADSLEEAGDRLFTFTSLDPSPWLAAVLSELGALGLNLPQDVIVRIENVLRYRSPGPTEVWAEVVDYMNQRG